MKSSGLLLATTLLTLTLGCSVEPRRAGYTKPDVKAPDFSKIKPAADLKLADSVDPLARVAPSPQAPPPVLSEEVRRADPNYRPANSYTDIDVGSVVDLRGLTLGPTETMLPKQVDPSNPVVIFFTRPASLQRKPLKLEDLKVTKKDGVKVNGRELKDSELLLTYWDDSAQGSEEDKIVKIPVLCVYHGERQNPHTLQTERQFLNRPCTAEEFKEIIERHGGIIHDYAGIPY